MSLQSFYDKLENPALPEWSLFDAIEQGFTHDLPLAFGYGGLASDMKIRKDLEQRGPIADPTFAETDLASLLPLEQHNGVAKAMV